MEIRFHRGGLSPSTGDQGRCWTRALQRVASSEPTSRPWSLSTCPAEELNTPQWLPQATAAVPREKFPGAPAGADGAPLASHETGRHRCPQDDRPTLPEAVGVSEALPVSGTASLPPQPSGPNLVGVLYLTTGPSDFELLRRSAKAAFLLESKGDTDVRFCPQGEKKQAHLN